MARSIVRRLMPVLATAGTLLATGLLAGCGAGQIAETSTIQASVPGANADFVLGPNERISIRNATVVYDNAQGYPAGADVPLSVHIFNSTTGVVTLTGVSATVLPGANPNAAKPAGPVVLTTAAANATPSESSTPAPAGSPAASAATTKPAAGASTGPAAPGTPSPIGSSSPAGPPSSAGSATPTPVESSSTPAGSAGLEVAIEPAGFVTLDPTTGTDGRFLQIEHLATAMSPGDLVNLVFTFTVGGNQVELGNADPPTGNPSPSPQPIDAPFAPPQSPDVRVSISVGAAAG